MYLSYTTYCIILFEIYNFLPNLLFVLIFAIFAILALLLTTFFSSILESILWFEHVSEALLSLSLFALKSVEASVIADDSGLNV